MEQKFLLNYTNKKIPNLKMVVKQECTVCKLREKPQTKKNPKQKTTQEQQQKKHW